MNTADNPEQNAQGPGVQGGSEAQELKGHVEETAGKVFGDDDLVARGRTDQIAAHAKQAAAQAGEVARNVGQRVRERAMHKLGALHERLHEAAEENKNPDIREDSSSDTHDLRQSGHEGAL